MATSKRTRANRRNAKRSTGPKSAGGRQRSSLNSLKHGITARTVLLPFEDRRAYDRAAKLIDEQYRPFGAIEECLVELIIAARWRLVRFDVAPKFHPVTTGVWRLIFSTCSGEATGQGAEP